MLRHYVKIVDNNKFLYIQKGEDFYKLDFRYASPIKHLYSVHLINDRYRRDNYIVYEDTKGYNIELSNIIFKTITKKNFVKGLL